MRKQIKPHVFVLRLAAVLLILVMLSTSMLAGRYARYASTATGGDSARVIRFGDLTLTESGNFYDGNKLMVIPGVDLTKKAVVDFTGSEAATYVFLEITPSNWAVSGDHLSYSVMFGSKTGLYWEVAAGWGYLLSENGTHVYYRALDPNTPLSQADIIAQDGKITVSAQITKSELASMTDVSIDLRISAVQAGGFASVTAAWNSIAAKEGGGGV